MVEFSFPGVSAHPLGGVETLADKYIEYASPIDGSGF